MKALRFYAPEDVRLEEVPDRRQRPPDARVVGHLAVLDRHVEVHAHERAFAICV
jgi:hypothetical protein